MPVDYEGEAFELDPGMHIELTNSPVLNLPLLLLWCVSVFGQDTATIIKRSVEANDRDWAEAPKYNYSKVEQTEYGKKTYSVMMVCGSPYERLIAVNGE